MEEKVSPEFLWRISRAVTSFSAAFVEPSSRSFDFFLCVFYALNESGSVFREVCVCVGIEGE